MAWRAHPDGEMAEKIWAPELHHIDGAWYIYFAAASRQDPWAVRMYVLENRAENPLEGEWTEKGRIATDWDSFSLDATTFEHRGQSYLVWAQMKASREGNSDLYIAAISAPDTIASPRPPTARTSSSTTPAPPASSITPSAILTAICAPNSSPGTTTAPPISAGPSPIPLSHSRPQSLSRSQSISPSGCGGQFAHPGLAPHGVPASPAAASPKKRPTQGPEKAPGQTQSESLP